MKRLHLSGGMLVFLGAVFWSLNSPLVKYLSLSSFLICGLRSVIAAVALCPLLRPRQLNWNGWMILYVVSYAGLCLSIIMALSMTAAPIAIGMQYTSIIWLFLVRLLKTRRFDTRAFIPVLVICVGVVFFMCSGGDSSSQLGNLIALVEGVFFACMTVGSKKAAGTNPVGLTAVANTFTGAVVFLLFPGALAGLKTMTGTEWLIMLVLGVVQVGGGYAFYNLGVQKVSAQKASIIALWEMILGPIWVALFLKEYPSLIVLIGFVIILAGMLLDSLLNSSGSYDTHRNGARQDGALCK